MAAIALGGDAVTTTALAIASCWPHDDAVLVEADPRGGSVAAWLDLPVTPSLSSIVAALHRSGSTVASPSGSTTVSAGPPASPVSGAGGVIDAMIRRAPGGLRFIPCPYSPREARRAIDEARHALWPRLADLVGTTIIDTGSVDATSPSDRLLDADVAVVIHRQQHRSGRAEAVRLERFAEMFDELVRQRERSGRTLPTIAIVGRAPFDPDEIAAHLGAPSDELVTLADDPMSAAVLAGRSGVSERRLRRQPLLRDARAMALELTSRLTLPPPSNPTATPTVSPAIAVLSDEVDAT